MESVQELTGRLCYFRSPHREAAELWRFRSKRNRPDTMTPPANARGAALQRMILNTKRILLAPVELTVRQEMEE